MIRASALALALTALFYPTLIYADSFNAVNGATIFQSRDRSYRIRSNTKPLQLSETSGLGGPTQLVDGKLFAFFDGKLYRTVDGLSYQLVEVGGTVTEPQFISREDTHLLFGRVNGATTSWRVNAGEWRVVTGTPPEAILPSQIGIVASRTILATGVSGQLRAHELIGNQWVEIASIGCGSVSGYHNTFHLGAVCDDGASWNFGGASWEPFVSEPVALRGSSPSVIVFSSITTPGRVIVASDGGIETIDLPSAPTGYYVAGSRVLVVLGAAGLHELLWRATPPELVTIASTFSAVTEVKNGNDEVLVSADNSAHLSLSPGVWLPLTAAGNFNNATRVSSGIWVWQANSSLTSGGLAQHLPDGQSSFVKVNPWSSTTSPVQATQLSTLPAYVSVITSSGSGNVNLYRSDNFISWSRLTLPSSPTLVRTIGTARELPSGTLIETTGVVSVPAGVVASDVIYIQDSTGGVQIFLSSTKGILGQQPSTVVRVTGEVSTSQTKRLVLELVDDIAPIGTSTLVDPVPIDYLAADLSVGRLVSLRGKIAKLSTDELDFEGDFRFQFALLGQNIKNIFKLNDVIEAIAVVDWNSSTDQVEAWYVGRGYSVIERASVPAAPSSVKTTTKKATSVKEVTAAQKPSSAVPVKQATSPTPRAATVRPMVQGARTAATTSTASGTPSDQPSTTVLTLLGVITGMLAVHGRRFRSVIRP